MHYDFVETNVKKTFLKNRNGPPIKFQRLLFVFDFVEIGTPENWIFAKKKLTASPSFFFLGKIAEGGMLLVLSSDSETF